MATSKSFNAFAFGLFILALWALLTGQELVRPIILPAPWTVVSVIPGMFGSGGIGIDVAITLLRVATALTTACVIGVTFGLFFGYREDLYAYVEGPIHGLRSVPATALFPLLLIVIGVGEFSIIALAMYPSLLVILVNTANGASLANKRRVHQAKILGLSARRLITDVLFFEALPSIFDGVRTAVSYCLVLVLAVEMFIGVGNTGLGRRIYEFQATYRIPEAYASIAIAAIIGILSNSLVSAIQNRLLHWWPHTRDEM